MHWPLIHSKFSTRILLLPPTASSLLLLWCFFLRIHCLAHIGTHSGLVLLQWPSQGQRLESLTVLGHLLYAKDTIKLISALFFLPLSFPKYPPRTALIMLVSCISDTCGTDQSKSFHFKWLRACQSRYIQGSWKCPCSKD